MQVKLNKIQILLSMALTMLVLAPFSAFGQALEQPKFIQTVIGFKEGVPAEEFALRYGLNLTVVFPETKNEKFAQVYKGEVPANIFSAIQNADEVEYIESDQTVKALAITTSDPFFTLDDTDENLQWYLSKARITDAWNFSKSDSSIIVAVVDTGIHAEHIELNDGRVGEGYNALINQPIFSNSNSDDNGHGTSVAGIIGAIPDNLRGIAGVAWEVQLMPIKALSADGTGDLSAVAAGVVWATDHGADIINLSLGGTSFVNGKVLADAITYAYDHGVFIVAAAGNDHKQQGLNLDQEPSYPVCADNGRNMVFGVAATDVNDQRAAFSDYGFNCIDISAPGKRILTTAYFPEDPSDNVLIYGSGTSMAAPVVAGIAALIKFANPEYTNLDIQNALARTADDIYPLNQNSCALTSCNGFLGKGRINAFAAVRPEPIPNAGMVRENSTGNIYIVAGGVKRLVTNFVFTQRGFKASNVSAEVGGQLKSYTTGDVLLPLEGSLIKSPNNSTVYVIHGEVIRPVSYTTFQSRGYNFGAVRTVPESEMVMFPLGGWYWPPDGTSVVVEGQPLVYVMDQSVARPTTLFSFMSRKLSFSRVIKISRAEFSSLPLAQDSYWLTPANGTLVKSEIGETVYVIEEGSKRALSLPVFTARKYNFNNIKTLPQAEIDVIVLGPDAQN